MAWLAGGFPLDPSEMDAFAQSSNDQTIMGPLLMTSLIAFALDPPALQPLRARKNGAVEPARSAPSCRVRVSTAAPATKHARTAFQSGGQQASTRASRRVAKDSPDVMASPAAIRH